MAQRSAQQAPSCPEPLDVFLAGSIFLDIVFSGLPTPPRPGTEVWAEGMGSLPGGIANLAVATARLGLTTGLAAGFGSDVYGSWCWELLREEGINLHYSTRLRHQHTSVTCSFAYGNDRSMVTHGHELPFTFDELIGRPPQARSVIIDLSSQCRGECWWRLAARQGAKVFADVGWDPLEQWDLATLQPLDECYAFVPNAAEAMAYTRTSSPRAALHALADKVPLAVVTLGDEGAIAIDNTTGEKSSITPPPGGEVLDATGAGDVFLAAFAGATVWDWPLDDRLAFAALCAALAVKQFGGSLAAPGIGDLHDWWDVTKQAAEVGDEEARQLRSRYAFLAEALPERSGRIARRAEATFAMDADL